MATLATAVGASNDDMGFKLEMVGRLAPKLFPSHVLLITSQRAALPTIQIWVSCLPCLHSFITSILHQPSDLLETWKVEIASILQAFRSSHALVYIAAVIPCGWNQAFYHLFHFDKLIASLTICATHLLLFLLSRRLVSYLSTLRSQLSPFCERVTGCNFVKVPVKDSFLSVSFCSCVRNINHQTLYISPHAISLTKQDQALYDYVL